MQHPTKESDEASYRDWMDAGRRAREAQEAEEASKKPAEVKLTRINSNEYWRSHPDWDRFYTKVEEESRTPRYSHLPIDDFKALMDIYQQVHNQGLHFNPVNFVFDIDNRIYAEWCMSPNEGVNAQLKNWRAHSEYQGEGFTSFMDKEVHYELERTRSEADRGSNEGYLRARQRVLGGLVLRAEELFSEWDGTSPKDCYDEDGRLKETKDKRNLRAREGLNDYIARYDSLRQQSQPQAA